METTKVLILGAGGAIAQHVIEFLIPNKDISLTLFARNPDHIKEFASSSNIILGDVLNQDDLTAAIKESDIVYANLAGQVDKMASIIVSTMEVNAKKRLIFVTSLGIYDEVVGKFGEWNNRIIGSELVRYSRAAQIIEKSRLDYTIIRPSWLTDKNETDYETTQKGEPFIGTEVSRKAVATCIANIIEHPEKDVRASLGVNKPGVYGDKPSFY